nr:hypothetical protein Iba_chr04fCG14280 [Ipomoea batatas]
MIKKQEAMTTKRIADIVLISTTPLDCVASMPQYSSEPSCNIDIQCLTQHRYPVLNTTIRIAEAPASSATFALVVKLQLPRCTNMASPIKQIRKPYSSVCYNNQVGQQEQVLFDWHASPLTPSSPWSHIIMVNYITAMNQSGAAQQPEYNNSCRNRTVRSRTFQFHNLDRRIEP